MLTLIHRSWGEFLAACEKPTDMPEDLRSSRQKHPKDEEPWTGTHTYQQAEEMALTGWIEKGQSIQEVAVDLFKSIASRIEKNDIVYDVEGSSLDVARLLDGEPEHWMRFVPEIGEGKGRIIRIVYNACVSGSVGNKTIEHKGEAILSLIYTLEHMGHRCEVIVATANYGPGVYHNTPSKNVETYTTVKMPNQPMDINRLAFALVSPSFLRRMVFSLWETFPKEQRELMNIRGIGSGYGSVGECSQKGDIYIGGSEGKRINWNDKTAVENWIVKQLEGQGVKLHQTN